MSKLVIKVCKQDSSVSVVEAKASESEAILVSS